MGALTICHMTSIKKSGQCHRSTFTQYCISLQYHVWVLSKGSILPNPTQILATNQQEEIEGRTNSFKSLSVHPRQSMLTESLQTLSRKWKSVNERALNHSKHFHLLSLNFSECQSAQRDSLAYTATTVAPEGQSSSPFK